MAIIRTVFGKNANRVWRRNTKMFGRNKYLGYKKVKVGGKTRFGFMFER